MGEKGQNNHFINVGFEGMENSLASIIIQNFPILNSIPIVAELASASATKSI